MKNYKKFRRIFEEIAITPEAAAEASANPENHDAAPMDPAVFSQPASVEPHEALPAPGETQSANDAFSMTVRDFVTKCKEIDPLVCMGIESFIEKNKASLETQPAVMPQVPAQDNMTFSNVVDQPAPAEPVQNFSLDQSPENLNFSNF
jgi:hypothetical protein